MKNLKIFTNNIEGSAKEQTDLLLQLYEKYCEKVGGRKVEGIVINCNNQVTKYVRMKSGKLVEYSDTDHKGDE